MIGVEGGDDDAPVDGGAVLVGGGEVEVDVTFYREESTAFLFTESHRDLFGPGQDTSAREKIKQLQIWANLQKLWRGKKSRKRPNLELEFKLLTGYDVRTVRGWKKEVKDNDGYVFEPQKRGRPEKKLEEDVEDFAALIDALVTEYQSKAGLTLDQIVDELELKHQRRFVKNQVRRALKRCGFKYMKRTGLWISRRENPDVLQELEAHCAWVKEHAVFNAEDESWSFGNMAVGFTDFSWVTTGMSDERGWGSKTNAHWDSGDKGARIAVTDIIFSDRQYTRNAKTYWNCNTQKGDRGFF